MKKRLLAFCLVFILALTLLAPASLAAWDPTLPSIYKVYSDYFPFGNFYTMSTFFGTSEMGQMMRYHVNVMTPSNEFKLDRQIGSSATDSESRRTYNIAVAAIEANETLTPEEKAAQIELANRNVMLTPTRYAQLVTFLNNVRNANLTRSDADKIKVRGHTFGWHGGQQPNYFFCNGFTYSSTNPDWASRETMLARLDSYIGKMFERWQDYNDIIIDWDVFNEVIDDFTGYPRNASDYQSSQWGRIFEDKTHTLTGDAKIYYESEFVRAAFAAARKYRDIYSPNIKLYYNDFQDSNKPYWVKVPATAKMLEPIYAAGNIDGFGMQGRMGARFPSVGLFQKMYNLYSTVSDFIVFSEGDMRSDWIPNPSYDPLQPSTVKGTTRDDDTNNPVCIVEPGWTSSPGPNAIRPEVMTVQADTFGALVDFLLSKSVGEGGNYALWQPDGLADNTGWNSNRGGCLFGGGTNVPTAMVNGAKYSYFTVIGAVPRYEIGKLLKLPVVATPSEDYITAAALGAEYRATEDRELDRFADGANEEGHTYIFTKKIFDLAAVDAAKAARVALEDSLFSVASSASLVTGYSANIPFTVKNFAGAVSVSLVDGNGTVLGDNSANNRSIALAVAPAAGTYTVVADFGNNTKIKRDIVISLVATAKDPKGTEFWTPGKTEDVGVITLNFNAKIAPASTGYKVSINSTPVAAANVAQSGDQTLAVTASANAGDSIVVKGVKLPDLFPSYVFTYTFTY